MLRIARKPLFSDVWVALHVIEVKQIYLQDAARQLRVGFALIVDVALLENGRFQFPYLRYDYWVHSV